MDFSLFPAALQRLAVFQSTQTQYEESIDPSALSEIETNEEPLSTK